MGTLGVLMTPTPYVLITGGAGHLGGAIAARVAATHRRTIVLDRHLPSTPSLGPTLLVDLTDSEATRTLLRTLVSTEGPPAGIVICHGWSPKTDEGSRLDDAQVSADLFRLVLDVNLTSSFVICAELLPAMAKAGGGRVVVVCSAAAHTGRTNASTAYVASKAGLRGMVHALAVHWASSGILMNDVSPGKISHPAWDDSAGAITQYVAETPGGRLTDAQDVVGLIDFLISDSNTYITGQSILVDGGRLA